MQELSKSLDLYRPIASVHRQKPTANRGVASRDLPLLLLVFTKGSLLTFKGGQSKKSLTSKTVAMALASDKNKVKCILGLWLLHWKEVTVYGELLPTFSAKTH